MASSSDFEFLDFILMHGNLSEAEVYNRSVFLTVYFYFALKQIIRFGPLGPLVVIINDAHLNE